MDDYNPLKDLFSLAGKAIDAKGAKDLAGEQAAAPYGVDEYGRTFLRGTPSAPGAFDPRLILLAVGAIALVGIIVLATR